MQSFALANGTKGHTDWNAINWRKANRFVKNLRQRIFRATTERNYKKVRSLQKLMLRSFANILTSVRRVTQQNAGRNTPGIDKVVVKSPATRGKLADELSTFTLWKAKPARRVYIPKSNGKQRPLGIPVVKDRCLQAMVKNSLEPEWEAKFEATSYGFRPGRSCHDAIEKIFSQARPNKRKKWVVDADIKGAFDNISHEFLLKAIGEVPGRELIKQWLKAGYMEQGVFHETDSGTPQGGVVSPLLANIALHGMEQAIGVKYDYRGYSVGKRAIVRYADDFAAFCESKEDAEETVRILRIWLKQRGLELSADKTKIVHLTEGFDFLGFNIRQYRADKTSKTGWKLLIKPSKESVGKLRNKLREKWLSLRGSNVLAIIKSLNPIIRGWANYFRSGVSREIFHSLDRWMFHRAVRYVKHTHPKKPRYWRQSRYWGRLNLDRCDRWVFGDKTTGMHLLKFSWFQIERHILVKGKSSSDDPNLKSYWHKREKAKAKSLTPSKQKIAKNQGCICPKCGESLFNEEELHIHHIKPKQWGGTDNYGNLQLLHLYCHQQIHAEK
ncbi:group II intron reverse transcriptase/maturase [Komarekiella sp. 'clone 1']|uniref:Group II intron reverse transcriptase/maturase n=1 Tax=Komarekiella delphini-convector SJRDD-AB1 TaxID=2593771 RepID=A0AA40VW40_9NOST|nr:group II intron reverse transcriptase/maturase [Komarekiella delphini-convector]MBD6621273.1 group II intron reverse transcriptase/maturase [Komarekiella delphini-convector SJRDD-AB1]